MKSNVKTLFKDRISKSPPDEWWFIGYCLTLEMLIYRVPFQYQIRRLIVRSREVSKPRDWYLELSDGPEIWQAPQKHCCWGACQISKRYDNSNYQSRGFETSWDLTTRRLIWYWNRAQDLNWVITVPVDVLTHNSANHLQAQCWLQSYLCFLHNFTAA